ncbi:MAG: enoyl-CoA hydratase-related protein [Nakamurella sp.]
MAAVLRTELAGGIATITLDSSGNRNALSRQLRSELTAALERVSADDATRVVVLTHTGPVFCAGMDLKETAVEQPGSEGVRELPRILQLIAHRPKPVVCRVGGPARAGGIGIMAASDIVVAVPGATFAFSEVRIGLVPAVISLPVLDRMDGVAARELFLTGAVFDAERALRTGLVNALASDDSQQALDEAVVTVVADLCKGGPTALAGTKSLLRQDYDDSDEQFALLLELSARQFSSGEGREGARAFAEKRPAHWIL